MASINVRQKGQEGEREICKFLNAIYKEVYAELKKEFPEKDIAQRNQNQSAVGGADISNSCYYAIEVKRQEQLSINTWWAQCVKSAWEVGKYPCLIYRQNGKKWRVVMFMNPILFYAAEKNHYTSTNPPRVEISMDDFREIFKAHAMEYIRANGNAT